jgi:2-oxoglutarate dehydrogenase E2 component (dihydrolipoamide succinyltransferase)
MIIEIKVPSPGESVAEAIIDRWYKVDGEYVEKDELIASIQSDKAMLELYAEASGVLTIKAQEGETVRIGQVIALIDTQAQPKEKKEGKTEERKVVEEVEVSRVENVVPIVKEESAVKAMPSAERLAKESHISLSEVPGTGKGGRITKSDVLTKLQQQTTKATSEVSNDGEGRNGAPVVQEEERPPVFMERSFERKEERKPLSQLRKTLANRLVAAKNETAMLTTFNEVNLAKIVEIRNRYKERFQEKYGVKLGFMSFFVKACCIALEEFPQVNSQWNEDELIFFNYVDMGVAVSTDRGLVVPVIRNAHLMNLAEIEIKIEELAVLARTNRLTIEEMRGGTFTITNGGVFGSLLSTPILNPPQTAILGMHRIQERPVALNGQVVIQPMMYLALSYDHRVIDGKEAVSFLYRVVQLLEDPVRLMLGI